jgi:hypothetical protein
MPLDITRYLHVPGAEVAPPPPPVRRGPSRVIAVDTSWPNGQACHSCGRRRLVPAWAPPRDLCRLPHLRPPIEGGGSPFFLSPWQASHCSRVRCSFPPTVIGPERGCGLSQSTTLRRHQIIALYSWYLHVHNTCMTNIFLLLRALYSSVMMS